MDYSHNVKQYHKISAATTTEERYDLYDVYVSLIYLFCFKNMFILRLTFCSNIITAVHYDATNFHPQELKLRGILQ